MPTEVLRIISSTTYLFAMQSNGTGAIVKLTDKGFGFIDWKDMPAQRDGTKRHLFFHANALVGVTYDELREGDMMTFSVEEGQKGLQAVDVKRAS